MLNLKELRPPSEERSFKTWNVHKEPVGIVRKALAKFGTMADYDKVISNFRRSESSDEALIRDFMLCNVPKHAVVKDETYKIAYQKVIDLFKPPRKYRPVHFADLRFYPWTVNTSVEAPFSTDSELKQRIQDAFKRGELPDSKINFRNAFNWVFERNRPIVHLIKDGKGQGNKFFYWNTAHARAHLVALDDPDKVRMVHGVPKLTLQVELMLLWPYINWIRKGETPIAWGYETLNGGLYRITNEVFSGEKTYQTWLCLDWRMFDKLTRFEIIDDVHAAWQSFMECDSGYIPTSDYRTSTTEGWRFRNLWKWMSTAVKFTPIRLPDGSEWKRNHCTLASGLLQTQILGSWINAIIIITCLIEMGINVNDIYLKVLGDDSLIGILETIPEHKFDEFLIRFAEIAKRRFGAVLNVKKSRIQRNLHNTNFLGYINDNSIPKRDPHALLAQLAYPERNWDINKLAARAVGICWASCGQSDLVYNVCRDVFEYCVNAGATPNPVGISWMDYLSISTNIDVSKFPAKEEILSRLMSPSTSPVHDHRFWNPDHFLAEF
nr:MAG: putative RNA-dependent RNA polymerase [Partitiviridae sp.]